MRKTAVVYDKWLSSLGGGEVVACSVAQVLEEEGYEVTLISGKKIAQEKIKEKLNIDLISTKFIEVWNDEKEIERLSHDKDLFINTSFLDYTRGFAKKNIYYAHFPTKDYRNILGYIFNKYFIPLILKDFKPMELIEGFHSAPLNSHTSAQQVANNSKIAFYFLKTNQPIKIQFKIYFENFYSTFFKKFKWEFEGAEVLSKTIKVLQSKNEIIFKIEVMPKKPTIYLNTFYDSELNLHGLENDKIYLIDVKVLSLIFSKVPYSKTSERLNQRFRAGVFFGIKKRLTNYQAIICHSQYVKYWIKKYWDREAVVLSPPVELLNTRVDFKKILKKDWICSVGRFFTLGHGKKQEVMIEAFKKLTDKYKLDWELHLVGGLGNEASSIKFFNYLKEQAKGYKIFFHTNILKKEVDEIYLKSKIYWHAAGFGENKKTWPVKQEHFGIAPIEAMSAKCVPILFNGGGLKEIIDITELDTQKNLFSTISELVENTNFYINNDNELNWEDIFKKLESNFSKQAFKNNFKKIIQN